MPFKKLYTELVILKIRLFTESKYSYLTLGKLCHHRHQERENSLLPIRTVSTIFQKREDRATLDLHDCPVNWKYFMEILLPGEPDTGIEVNRPK